MIDPASLSWAAFAMGSSLVILVFMLVGGRKPRLQSRLRDLPNRGKNVPELDPVAEFARSTLPKMGAPLVPKDEEERSKLQARLNQAGLYSRQAMALYLGIKLLMIVAP